MIFLLKSFQQKKFESIVVENQSFAMICNYASLEHISKLSLKKAYFHSDFWPFFFFFLLFSVEPENPHLQKIQEKLDQVGSLVDTIEKQVKLKKKIIMDEFSSQICRFSHGFLLSLISSNRLPQLKANETGDFVNDFEAIDFFLTQTNLTSISYLDD